MLIPIPKTRQSNGAYAGGADQDVSSDAQPADALPSGDEYKWTEYVKTRFREARTSARRQAMERQVLQSLCMVGDDAGQWKVWRGGTGMQAGYTDIRLDPDGYDRYVTDPQILPILDRVVSLATASSPDATFTGVTTADTDQAAAKEAEGVETAWEEDFDLPAHLLDAANMVVRTTTLWAHYYWDPQKRGLVPEIGPDGQASGAKPAAAGGPIVQLIPWQEGFPYAETRDARQMRGFIIAKLLPLTELVQRYGDAAKSVQGDGPGDTLSYFQSRYAYLAGQWDWQPEDTPATKRTHAVCYELLEPASPKYPQGLRLVVAGDRVLYRGKLPGKDASALPLVSLAYHRQHGTPWGTNAVLPLASLQRAINRAWTDALDVLHRQKLYLVVQDGTGLEPDAYSRTQADESEMQDIIQVRVKPGAVAPQFQLPPAPSGQYLDLVERLLDHMKAISGIRDAISGQAPASDSGIKVNLLQQAAKSQLALFTSGIETFVRDLVQGVVTLYAENAKTTQLLAVAPDGDGQVRGREAAALKHLTAGGQVRVRVTPGSAMPKLPESQDQDLNEMAQAGLFQPQNLPASIALLKAKSWSSDSALVDNLIEALQMQMQQDNQKMQQEKASQPDPLALQQQQQQAQAQQQQAQQQHQAEMQAAADHAVQMQTEAQMELQAAKDHAASELSAQNHAQMMELTRLKASLPAIALSGTMGPTATESAEREVGLESDTAAEADEAQENETQQAQMQQQATLKTAQMKQSTPKANNKTISREMNHKD